MGGTLGGLVALEMGGLSFAYLQPRLAAGEFGGVITAGAVDDFPPGSVTHIPNGRFYLARLADGGFVALYQRCTHLGCTVPWDQAQNAFVCPCHNSQFGQTARCITRPPRGRSTSLPSRSWTARCRSIPAALSAATRSAPARWCTHETRHLPTHTLEGLIGLAATAVIAAALMVYALWEPARIASAQDQQLATDLDQAMTLYAENCVVCHGSDGAGIGATPPLATDALRTADYATLVKVIARGRTGTAMPAWSQEDAGPLSAYQVGELATLIQYGDWGATAQRVADLGLEPRLPVSTTVDEAALALVRALPEGDQLAQALSLYAANCVACHGTNGEGTALAPALNSAAVQAKDPAELAATITNGVPSTLMSGWSNVLTAEEITSLATLLKNWDQIPAGAVAPPPRRSPSRPRAWPWAPISTPAPARPATGPRAKARRVPRP